MVRVTGSVVYGYVRCPRAAELDLHGDRSRRRPWTAAEELLLQRGRELEERLVTPLGYSEPEYEAADFDAGAEATRRLLRAGVPGISQGVLRCGDLLGIPDLLRRVDGDSALGGFHYEVGDVKSSTRPRTQQVMQVAFYSHLLAIEQERRPQRGFLMLKDGREEVFALDELQPVADDVLQRVQALADGDGGSERPFLAAGCRGCSWRDLCAEDLRAGEDLSLLGGMTRGLRTTLEQAGYRRCSELLRASADSLTRRARIEPALARRTLQAARSWRAAAPLPAADPPRGNGNGDERVAVLHLLDDAFADRVLAFGGAWLDGSEPHQHVEVASDRGAEAAAFRRVLDAVPHDAVLLHWGEKLPRWLDHVVGRGDEHDLDVELHGRLVDLGRRLTGMVTFPGPVFDRRDAVRLGLGADPARAGDDDEAALFAGTPEGGDWLRAKMLADLHDLLELKRRWLDS